MSMTSASRRHRDHDRLSRWLGHQWLGGQHLTLQFGAHFKRTSACPLDRRRALVEGAWAYRMKARIGRHKVDRIEALPKDVREIGRKRKSRSSPDIAD